jgi:hypothetical protein
VCPVRRACQHTAQCDTLHANRCKQGAQLATCAERVRNSSPEILCVPRPPAADPGRPELFVAAAQLCSARVLGVSLAARVAYCKAVFRATPGPSARARGEAEWSLQWNSPSHRSVEPHSCAAHTMLRADVMSVTCAAGRLFPSPSDEGQGIQRARDEGGGGQGGPAGLR